MGSNPVAPEAEVVREEASGSVQEVSHAEMRSENGFQIPGNYYHIWQLFPPI